MAKATTKSKTKPLSKKPVKRTQPIATLIICASACLAVMIGLYFANKANVELKRKENDSASGPEASTPKSDQSSLVHPGSQSEGHLKTDEKEAAEVKTRKERAGSGVKKKSKTKQEEPHKHFKVLPRLDGVKVGHIQQLELSPGKTYEVITRSLRPPIFEIPEFLSDAECQQIIDQSTRQGLETSEVADPETGIKIEATTEETFFEWDYNGDGVISIIEIMHNLIDLSDLYFSEEDVKTMFKDLKIDINGNGVMDLDEFLHVTTDRIMRYLHRMAKRLPRVKSRNSRQTWVDHTVIQGLDQRVAALLRLPVSVVAGSEKLQVVNYGAEGHYHCHHDSQDLDDHVPCCHEHDKHHCRLCRYATVLYFLNDVEEGGETAFPVADNTTFSIEAWGDITKYRCDLSRHCHKANLYIKPKKRSAIMWYNHHRDETTGWLGDQDKMTYHGGCDVTKGRKWIANNWINIIGASRDAMYLHTNPDIKVPI